QFADAERSWNGAYCLSHVPDGHTPDAAWPVMMPWPFLFCQKPIVRAPFPAGGGGTIGMLTVSEASGASFEDTTAMFTRFPPAVSSACVTVCCPVQVIDAPTASVVAGHVGGASVLSSTNEMPVSTEVPVFVTR